jgi:hypothetical protein
MSKHSLVCGVLACLLAPLAAAEEKPADPLRVGAAAVEIEADDSMNIEGGIFPFRVNGQEGKLRAIAVVLEKPDITGSDIRATVQAGNPWKNS